MSDCTTCPRAECDCPTCGAYPVPADEPDTTGPDDEYTQAQREVADYYYLTR